MNFNVQTITLTQLDTLNTICPHPNFDCVGDYPVHYVLRKGVKVFVCPSHEFWFQQVAAAAVILKHSHV